ncbi:MAG: thioesterase family protein [Rhodobacteraceae bacterium]|nr:thioesterase family protein [Paracoccaceae bacterium]
MTDSIALAPALARMQFTDGAFRAPVPENWMQGRTTYGGFAATLLLDATLHQHPDLPPLRSAMVNFVAPVADEVAISVTPLRTGRNVTSLEARGHSGDNLAITASFVFGTPMQSGIAAATPAPEAPPPETLGPMIPPQAAALAPRFHRNFEMLRIEGDLPLSGSKRGYIRAWVRHRDPAAHHGLLPLFCIADVLPPAVFPMFPRLGRNSSMTWMFNLLDPAPATTDGWWHVETAATGARDGYSSQHMRVWNAAGRIVADGMQSVVVFV